MNLEKKKSDFYCIVFFFFFKLDQIYTFSFLSKIYKLLKETNSNNKIWSNTRSKLDPFNPCHAE